MIANDSLAGFYRLYNITDETLTQYLTPFSSPHLWNNIEVVSSGHITLSSYNKQATFLTEYVLYMYDILLLMPNLFYV